MPNTYVDLPVPAGNGAGAAQDTSMLAATKTVTVSGSFAGVLQLQASNDGGASFGTVASLMAGREKQTFQIAAGLMRIVRSGAGVPLGSPEVNVSAETTTAYKSAVFAIPGVGQASPVIDIQTFGTFNTLIGAGEFSSVFALQISDDLNEWVDCAVFSYRDLESKAFTAKYIRLFRRTGGGGAAFFSIGSLPDDSTGDEKVKISGNDQVTDFLENKLVQGPGVVLTKLNPGGDEEIEISAPGATSDSDSYFYGVDTIAAAADTRYLVPGKGGTAGLSDVQRIPATRNGTLNRLFVRHNSAGGNGQSVIYNVLVNGVATGLTVTLATGAVGFASDTVHTAPVVAGDSISIQAVKNNGIGGGNIDVEAVVEIS